VVDDRGDRPCSRRPKTAKDMTFTAEPDAAAAFAGLKPGDQVQVSDVAGQGHLTAKAIAKNDHMTKE